MPKSISVAVIGLATVALVVALVQRSSSPELGPTATDETTVEELGRRAIVPWACPSGSLGGMSCGFVDAPADHDRPGPDRVRIFVASIDVPVEATGNPIVVLGDRLGPGTVGDLTKWRSIGRSLGRRVVLVDLRGTGASEPRATCSELVRVDYPEADLADVEAVAAATNRRRAAVDLCQSRTANLPGSPVMTLDAIVRDLELVRAALEIDRWTIVGGSETDGIALRYEREWSDAVESLVLFRTAPDSTDRYAQRAAFSEEVLNTALRCESCNTAALDAIIAEAEDRLAGRSIVVTVPAGEDRRRVSANARVVRSSLAWSLINPDFRASLTNTLDRLADGEWRALAAVRGRTLATHNVSGMSTLLALKCGAPLPIEAAAENGGDTTEAESVAEEGEVAEEAEATAEGTVDAEGRSNDVWAGVLDDPLVDPAVCGPTPEVVRADQPPRSPTLVVNQAFDYVAPGSAGAMLDQAWPTATAVTLREADPSLQDACTLGVVAGFLDNSPATLTC
jgi:pimeloyl-ACP methyl ester carboxylesterase